MIQHKTNEKRRAILIGSQTYNDSEFEQLHCPRNDVAELKFLFEADSFKFDEVIDLVDQESSHVEQQIEAVLEDSEVGDFILIYFSGHGERDWHGEGAKLFLCFKNTNKNRLLTTAFKYDKLDELIKRHNTERVVVILDCCFAGLAAAKGPNRREIDEEIQKREIQKFKSELVSGKGKFVLCACGATEQASQGEKLSIFTQQISIGLRTGDADLDDDGKISISELASYVKREFRKNNIKQEPASNNYEKSGSLILCAVPIKAKKSAIRSIPLPSWLRGTPFMVPIFVASILTMIFVYYAIVYSRLFYTEIPDTTSVRITCAERDTPYYDFCDKLSELMNVKDKIQPVTTAGSQANFGATSGDLSEEQQCGRERDERELRRRYGLSSDYVPRSISESSTSTTWLFLVQNDIMNHAQRRLEEAKAKGNKCLEEYYTQWREHRLVATLFNEQVHLIVRKDSDIMALQDLQNKKVNVGAKTSGTYITAMNILGEIKVRESYLGLQDSLAQLDAESLHAVFYVGRAPVTPIRSKANLRFINIELKDLPSSYRLDTSTYSQTGDALTSTNYPTLVNPVKTVQTGAVLATFDYQDTQRCSTVNTIAELMRRNSDKLKAGDKQNWFPSTFITLGLWQPYEYDHKSLCPR